MQVRGCQRAARGLLYAGERVSDKKLLQVHASKHVPDKVL